MKLWHKDKGRLLHFPFPLGLVKDEHPNLRVSWCFGLHWLGDVAIRKECRYEG
jgi:hypothetical protein